MTILESLQVALCLHKHAHPTVTSISACQSSPTLPTSDHFTRPLIKNHLQPTQKGVQKRDGRHRRQNQTIPPTRRRCQRRLVHQRRSHSNMFLRRRPAGIRKFHPDLLRHWLSSSSSSSNGTNFATPQPTQGPGLVETFVCNCTDCRKITASMFASNFTIDDTYLKHLRGRDNLASFGQSHTIASGHKMTNYFCRTCGTLMYRVGAQFPGKSILRIGTVDDFNLHETKLRPQREQFVQDRVAWLSGVEGVEKYEGMP